MPIISQQLCVSTAGVGRPAERAAGESAGHRPRRRGSPAAEEGVATLVSLCGDASVCRTVFFALVLWKKMATSRSAMLWFFFSLYIGFLAVAHVEEKRSLCHSCSFCASSVGAQWGRLTRTQKMCVCIKKYVSMRYIPVHMFLVHTNIPKINIYKMFYCT